MLGLVGILMQCGSTSNLEDTMRPSYISHSASHSFFMVSFVLGVFEELLLVLVSGDN